MKRKPSPKPAPKPETPLDKALRELTVASANLLNAIAIMKQERERGKW